MFYPLHIRKDSAMTKKLLSLFDEEFTIRSAEKDFPKMKIVYAEKNKLVVWAVPDSWTNEQIKSALSLARSWYMLGKSEGHHELEKTIQESCDNR